jgi:hypothetical protein
MGTFFHRIDLVGYQNFEIVYFVHNMCINAVAGNVCKICFTAFADMIEIDHRLSTETRARFEALVLYSVGKTREPIGRNNDGVIYIDLSEIRDLFLGSFGTHDLVENRCKQNSIVFLLHYLYDIYLRKRTLE